MKDERHTTGLTTTAASIWLVAAIGTSAGMGREATAVLATALALVILAALPRIEMFFSPNNVETKGS